MADGITTGKDRTRRVRPTGAKTRYGRVVRRKLPSAMRLREVFFYDPKTGILRFRSGRQAGQQAGNADRVGYKRIMVDGIVYQVHRLIWKMCTWKDPEHEIDHRNGDKGDNRWLNLRPATLLQNGKNRPLKQKNNTSGFKGVSFHKGQAKWSAVITADGRAYSLGYFDRPEEAAAAYNAAAVKYHGSFARTSP